MKVLIPPSEKEFADLHVSPERDGRAVKSKKKIKDSVVQGAQPVRDSPLYKNIKKRKKAAPLKPTDDDPIVATNQQTTSGDAQVSGSGKVSLDTRTVVLQEAMIVDLIDPAPSALLQQADLDQSLADSFEPTLVINSDATDFSDVEGDGAEQEQNPPPYPKPVECQPSTSASNIEEQGQKLIVPMKVSHLQTARSPSLTGPKSRVSTPNTHGRSHGEKGKSNEGRAEHKIDEASVITVRAKEGSSTKPRDVSYQLDPSPIKKRREDDGVGGASSRPRISSEVAPVPSSSWKYLTWDNHTQRDRYNCTYSSSEADRRTRNEMVSLATRKVGRPGEATSATNGVHAPAHPRVVTLTGVDDLVAVLRRATVLTENGAPPVIHRGRAVATRNGDPALARRRRLITAGNLAKPTAHPKRNSRRKSNSQAFHTPTRRSEKSPSLPRSIFICKAWLGLPKTNNLQAEEL